MAIREVKKKSVVPIYGTAAAIALDCALLPKYKLSHFIILAGIACAAYLILSKLFPGTVEQQEIPDEPVTTGNEIVDALILEGNRAVNEMKRLRSSIKEGSVREKVGELITVTEKIFKDVAEDPNDAPQVRRFSNYYLPTTIKLLNAYERMSLQDIDGENISGTLSKIDDILDTTIIAYKKQLDALFADQALDIETDITVLEGMLKREGLTGKDF